MNAADSQALRQQYAARWLELKHTITAKYFSDRDLAGTRARPLKTQHCMLSPALHLQPDAQARCTTRS
jgi:hypothetical protein